MNVWMVVDEVNHSFSNCMANGMVLNQTMDLAGSAKSGGQGQGEQCKDRIAKGRSMADGW